MERSDSAFLALVNKIKTHPWLEKATIIYIGESNTGDVSGRHAAMLRKIDNTYSLKDKAERVNPGVWTDKYRKRDYANALTQALCHEAIVFLDDLITNEPETGTVEKKREQLKDEFLKQAYRARPTVARTTADMVPSFQSWSAKLDNNGKFDENANDDILFAATMTTHWMNMHIIGQIANNTEMFHLV